MTVKKTLSFFLCAAFLCASVSACSSQDAKKSAADSTDAQNITLKITEDYHYSDMDESAIRAYEKLCNAVLNYETEVKFNTSLTDDVNRLFYTSFPQYVLVDGISFLDDKSGVSVTYANDEETQTAKLEQFNSEVKKIMAQCKYGTASKNEYLLNVYSYIARNFTVDNSVTNVFDTVIQKKGINSAIAGLFEYLLLQGDVKASHIMSSSDGSIASMMSLAEFNGEYYFFNVAAETEYNGGDGLHYFAMNSERALSSKKGGFVYTDNAEVDKITDDAYSQLEDCSSYEINGSKVKASLKIGDTFEFELN